MCYPEPMTFAFEPIGTLHSCFKAKFGIPRQPGLVPDARAVLALKPPFSRAENLQGLEVFSHLWLVYVFHAVTARPDKSSVRPPRLGGQRRVGVFASRSNFRPNPIGLSVCELEAVEIDRGHGVLHLKGVDILDQTPILDIKPYLPYADSHPQALAGWATHPPAARYSVHFSAAADTFLESLPCEESQCLQRLIRQVLSLDPRPAYDRQNARKTRFGMRLARWDVRWEVLTDTVEVKTLVPLDEIGTPTGIMSGW